MEKGNKPKWIYHGRDKGYIKAEPEFDSRTVDDRPAIPGADVTHLISTESGIDNPPKFSAVVFPGGKMIIASRDSNIISQVNDLPRIVEEALENFDPTDPEGYANSNKDKPQISLVKNGKLGFATIKKNPKPDAA